jgi:hypothetical protein
MSLPILSKGQDITIAISDIENYGSYIEFDIICWMNQQEWNYFGYDFVINYDSTMFGGNEVLSVVTQLDPDCNCNTNWNAWEASNSQLSVQQLDSMRSVWAASMDTEADPKNSQIIINGNTYNFANFSDEVARVNDTLFIQRIGRFRMTDFQGTSWKQVGLSWKRNYNNKINTAIGIVNDDGVFTGEIIPRDGGKLRLWDLAPIWWDGVLWHNGSEIPGREMNMEDDTMDVYITTVNGVATTKSHIRNLYIWPLADLTISPGAGVWVNDTAINFSGDTLDFVLQSDATGWGQYIGPTMKGEFHGYIPSTGGADWRYISIPIEGRTIPHLDWDPSWTMQLSGHYWYGQNVFIYNTPGGGIWDDPNGAHVHQTGHLVWFGDNVLPNTPRVAGDLNLQSVTHNLYNTVAIGITPGQGSPGYNNHTYFDGWNMIANSFTAYVNWDQVTIPAGVDTAIHWWNPSIGNFSAYVQGTGIGINGGGPAVSLMQPFFVRSAVNTTLVLTPNETSFGTALHTKGPNLQPIILKVSSDSTHLSDEIMIYFNQNAKAKFEGSRDAWKMMSQNPNAPNLFSISDGVYFSINALPEFVNSTNVPVGFRANPIKEYHIEANLESVDPTWEVYLEDKDLGIWHDLRGGDYSFSHLGGAADSRFLLHINESPTVSLEEMASENLTVFMGPEGLNINFGLLEGMADVRILNIAGQTLYRTEGVDMSSKLIIPAEGWAHGIYIVDVVANGERMSQKFVH